MTLRLTSAPVSGIKKRSSTARTHPSPFAAHARRKPTSSGAGVKGAASDWGVDDPLPDQGSSQYISETAPVQNVVQAIQYIRTGMFDELPARAGMNSTRIAEVLNLRRSLPPLASVAHVHTLLDAPTQVEREIVELVQSGRVRRLIVPGRGGDAAGLGDCLVLAEEWEELVRGNPALGASVKEKFLDILSRIGTSSAISQSVFTPDEYRALIRAGFLVSSSAFTQGSLSIASLPNLPQTTSTPSASRSESTPIRGKPIQSDAQARSATLFLSLPNTGTYLRLLGAGRAHLLTLLRRSSSAEAPLSLLKDRWDGAVETEKSFHMAKRARGEFAGVLPGKTKKWKDLYGMQFRWVLEEALGAGLVELFETGSVGPGLRQLWFSFIPTPIRNASHPTQSARLHLPPGAPISPPNSARPELSQFITTALREAISLLDTTIPSTLTADSKLRPAPPSHAKVKLLRGWRKPAQSDSSQAQNGPGKGEFWVCRLSEHVDSAVSGTASWEEFEDGLRHDHAKHEMEYTPSVTALENLLQWEGPELEMELEVEGVVYTDFEVEVNLITHTFRPGALIAPRSFVSLTISAKISNKLDPEQVQQQQQSPPGFVTIQIPLHPDPSSTPAELHQRIHSTVPRRTIFASYASVERVVSRRSSTQGSANSETTGSGHVLWTMATTSDAGGSIPQWVQRNWTLGGVPRAVVADVGLFIGWTDERRKSRVMTGSS